MVVLLALAFALVPVVERLPGILGQRHAPPQWNGVDADVTLLHLGLQRTPHFPDTLHWWNGPWVGFIPYWRPLTSYLFWFEWKGFGEREWLFTFPAIAAHLAAALLFALFVYRLAASRRLPAPAQAAAVAAWGYAFGFPGVFFHDRDRVTGEIITLWKNQPDSWTAICCFASLLCYLKAQRGSRAGLFGAVAWFVIGCGFKELTLPLVAVYAALELPFLWRGPRAPALRRLTLVFLVAAGMAAWRSYCVRSVWYSYASNGAWVERTLTELLGPFGALATLREWLGNALGIWTLVVVGAALYRLRIADCGLGIGSDRSVPNPQSADPPPAPRVPAHSPHRALVGWTAAAALLGGWWLGGAATYVGTMGIPWRQALTPDGLGCSLMATLDFPVLMSAAGTILWLLALLALLRHDWSLAALGLCWTAAFLALYTFSPGNIYRYYLPQDGYLLMIALAAGSLKKAVASSQ
jgi:hypothetical protein